MRAERVDRPDTVWVVVAVSVAIVAGCVVAWRGAGGVENRQTGGVLLGAPSNTLGYDGRAGNPFWLNLAGPQSYTFDGDRFTAGCVGDAPGLLTTNNADEPGQDSECRPNPDLDRRGHLFVVRVDKAESQRPLDIDVADPRLRPTFGRTRANGSPGCEPIGPTFSADPRQQALCSGDKSPRATGFTTTFVVRAPDTTPTDPTDNPAICAATYAADATSTGRTTGQSWERLCTIPAAQVQQGDYIVQVRSNADLSSPRESRSADLEPTVGAGSLERADPNSTGDGQNHFALRAQWDGGPDENRAQGLAVEGLNHLVMFVNQRSSAVLFPIMNLTSSAAGKSVRLRVFDLGDLATSNQRPSDLVDVHVEAPLDARVDGNSLRDLDGCSFRFESARGPDAVVENTCALTGASRASFNGKQVTIAVPVPSAYTCESTTENCWLNIELNYHGSPNDNTGWTAEIIDSGTPPAPPS